MKKYFNKIMLLVLAAALSASFMSCKPEPDDDKDTAAFYEILASFTDNTVIATYKLMADKAVELDELCQELRSNPSDAAVAAAAQKWKDARVYWEQSEAFLFGPAEYNNLDPHIDSWPLDKAQLDAALASPNILNIDAATARANYGVNLLGFHAVEYVLFRDGAPRPINDIPASELAYLTAIARILAEDCILLEASWAGMDKITDQKAAILEEAELEISTNFGREMKNAGKAGSRFLSVQGGMEEMIEGCKDIADEVGNSKIADPVESGEVLKVESWYSWNSLADFKDNIRSIENVYLGGRPEKRGKSLSSFIKDKDANLDAEIKIRIATAMTKIDAIGHPFRNNLHNTQGAQEAIDACDALFASLQKTYKYIE